MISNRATTVAQGTMIRAVLETALNSTHPGFARAIVSRDVMGFDGTRVLIPRGSRLIGDYSSDIAQGQKRALINWTRLSVPTARRSRSVHPRPTRSAAAGEGRCRRPFLATVFLVDPPVGARPRRQSRVAQSRGNGDLFASRQHGKRGWRTQCVRSDRSDTQGQAGASISIFVARDLDFSSVETRR